MVGEELVVSSANPPWRHHTGPSDSLTCPKNRLPHSRIRFRPDDPGLVLSWCIITIHLHNLSKGNESVVVLYTGGDEKLQAGLGYDFEVSELSDLCNLDYVDHEVEESEEE
ncbi:hypothetical protein Tsubulata_020249 [Turnera subulata]|uniref:Uncharacterized protein n=1 Tax=Turnera subulata TaxID=218843 RepID=A0A9Q0GE80_9ROSI|nr:hypothetical protein Tsubulata_020249 [Turnera subulata]